MIKFNPMGPSLLDGPPGSDPWNEAVCRSLQLTVEDKDRYRRKDLWDNMQRVYDHGVWNLFPPDRPVGIKKFSEEITGKPWDWILNELECVGAKSLAKKLKDQVFKDTYERANVGEHGEFGKGRPKEEYRVDSNNNVNSKTQGGNSATYRLAKLKKTHPGIAERYANGEFKSVA